MKKVILLLCLICLVGCNEKKQKIPQTISDDKQNTIEKENTNNIVEEKNNDTINNETNDNEVDNNIHEKSNNTNINSINNNSNSTATINNNENSNINNNSNTNNNNNDNNNNNGSNDNVTNIEKNDNPRQVRGVGKKPCQYKKCRRKYANKYQPVYKRRIPPETVNDITHVHPPLPPRIRISSIPHII